MHETGLGNSPKASTKRKRKEKEKKGRKKKDRLVLEAIH